ncbi:MAG: S8 family serine peptidase, partial [Alphaproteobacteria bacterium]
QLWRLPYGLAAEAVAEALRRSGIVENAEPNYVISASITPNDPNFSKQWALHNTGQAYATSGGAPVAGSADADIDAPTAWDMQTAAEVVVAVIDSGINLTHPDLVDNLWRNEDEVAGNGIDDDGNGYVDDYYGYDFHNGDADPSDDNGHGTHVAGIIAAEGNNGIGVAGVAWNATVMAVKFLDATGSGLTSNAIAALNYAVANGAAISNASWSGAGHSTLLSNAIAAAGAAGHLVVAAAGNNGVDLEVSPRYPVSHDLDNIIAVAATDDDDLLASYSNYGADSVDLAAPGSNIYSTLGTGYAFLSGTSMATPYVTGAATLVWSVNPALTWQEVKDIILASVDPLPALDGKVATGGRLNLTAALQAAGGAPPPPPPPIGVSIEALSADKAEGTGGTTAFTFRVTLDAPAPEALSVSYSVIGAGANAATGGDFQGGVLPVGTASFALGATTATISIQVAGDATVEADEGFQVTLQNPSEGMSIAATGAFGTIRNDDVVAQGQTITGTSGANSLSGGAGDDTIYGLEGKDQLTGAAGADLLDGGPGADTMTGGNGDDTFVVAQSADVVSEAAGGGIDLVLASIAYTLPANVEDLTLTGTANVAGTGNAGANRITGNGGRNTLTGNDGADRLDGGAGNDSLLGGGGDDTLIGGLGKDTLNGGGGRDVLVFDVAPIASNRGLVVGYSAADDTIHLDNAIFGAIGPDGALAANAFFAGSTATSASHRILYASNTLSYDADGVGGAAAVQIATFSGTSGSLTAADFWVI